MPRPKKQKPTCATCGRSFDRQNNLEWHQATHAAVTGETPADGEEHDPMAESCPNCHTLEHKVEKQDGEMEKMAEDLRSAATALRQPPKADGHQDFQTLLDCPSCGPGALASFEKKGGAVLPPGQVKPELVRYVKEHFPIFSAEVEV
jgi:ssDNA-binding Zn-finger/Zn-ribbon topoisomerase 1